MFAADCVELECNRLISEVEHYRDQQRSHALCFQCNVRYRLADLGSCHTGDTDLRYVVASVGKMDTVGKVAQSRHRPIRAVSLLRGVPF